MSKAVVVYRVHPTAPITVKVMNFPNGIGYKVIVPLTPQHDDGVCTNQAVCSKKYFGSYTLDGASQYYYTAYVHDSIDQWEITQEIADTIFIMAEKEKFPV